jgi:hypothetical protein
MEGATLAHLLASAPFRALASFGGAGLVTLTDPSDPFAEYSRLTGSAKGNLAVVPRIDLGNMVENGVVSSARLRSGADRTLNALDHLFARDELVILVSTSIEGSARNVGAAIVARGLPSEMIAAMRGGPAPTETESFTSDSTQRDGVATEADLARTIVRFKGLEGQVGEVAGSSLHVVDSPPPLDLYERYLQQRRLYVPVGTAAGIYVTVAGLFGIAVLAMRRRPAWLSTTAIVASISVVPLAVALLMVGHLSSLTYATVVPFVVGLTLIGAVALEPVRRSVGPAHALALTGVAVLAILVVESALGWTAALTPLLGGSELDGGRFFGMPNVQIGLLLGSAVFVADRIPSRIGGAAVMATAGLFAGLPWTGSNLGGAVTLLAAAGLWWGIRGHESGLRTAAATIGVTLAGTVLVVVAHRYLTSEPTHVTRLVESTGGATGLWDRFVDRLEVGVDLIANNPFALVPVAGVLGTLLVVLRPPATIRDVFDDHPGWRDVPVTILLGSVVAYVANDSGAAALGLGFGTALGALLYVSLTREPAKMVGT